MFHREKQIGLTRPINNRIIGTTKVAELLMAVSRQSQEIGDADITNHFRRIACVAYAGKRLSIQAF